MPLIKYINKIKRNPYKLISSPITRISSVNKMIPDTIYLKIIYRSIFGRSLNLENPKTYNEKLQWLKLYDRNPLYTKLVDKYLVKQYVAEIIGEEHVIPTLGLYDSFADIDFSSFPDKFVLKTTHDSGGVIICNDKKLFDIDSASMDLTSYQKKSFFYQGREWPYKNVQPRIIAEKHMSDGYSDELKDYKFFCFNGEVKAMFIASDRGQETTETKFDFFDANFNHLDFTNGHPNSKDIIEKPQNFDEMKRLAELLSNNIPHVRIDLYDINGKIYFGEMTFYHWSGFVPFDPEKWDYKFGSWIELPSKRY